MVVGKHREDLFAHEESWLAVRELFCCLGQRHTDSAYSPQMLAIEIKFGIGWRLCHGKPCPNSTREAYFSRGCLSTAPSCRRAARCTKVRARRARERARSH